MEFTGKVSIIIPCYNEEQVISATHSRVCRVLQESNLTDYEIVYINDGSSDGTFKILQDFAFRNSKIKIVDLSRNFGHQAALSAGIHNCSGDIAIIIDADLQDPPELFGALIETYLQEKCNMVYCVRKNRKGESWLKTATASWFYRFVQQISDHPFPRDTGDFRLIDRQMMEEFMKLKEKNKFIRGLFCWIGFKQVPFYFEREKRKEGKTKYSLFRMFKFAVNGITYFSGKPLFWAFKIGICSFLLAIFTILGLIFLPAVFSFSPQSATTLLLIMVLLMGGLHFFILGILGIYLKNVFDEQKDRPEYIIRQIING